MDYDEELDVCGLVCPMPALKTKKKLMTLKPGQVLKVILDYEPAVESVPRDLAKTKHKFLGQEENDEDEGWFLYFECVK
ncbi:MAG: sulfurtransferase TusA family protein [Promethearchaeota archaeon]